MLPDMEAQSQPGASAEGLAAAPVRALLLEKPFACEELLELARGHVLGRPRASAAGVTAGSST